jgi:hypothetical protein
MTVRELKAKLENFDDDDLDVYVLVKGDDDEYEVQDVREGELEDDGDESVEDVVFIMA